MYLILINTFGEIKATLKVYIGNYYVTILFETCVKITFNELLGTYTIFIPVKVTNLVFSYVILVVAL